MSHIKKDQKGFSVIEALIIAVIIVALGGVGYVVFRHHKAATYGTNTTGSQQYTDRLGFKITPPKGWEKVSNCNGNIVCFKSSTTDSASSGKFSDVISVNATKLSSNSAKSLTLDQIFNASISSLSKSETGFKLEGTIPETINGVSAKLATMTFEANNQNITADSLFIISNDISYSITGQSLSASWPQNNDIIKTSLLSFVP